MNIVQATCPHCKNTLRIPADWLDRPMRCKHCKNSFQAKAKAPDAPAPPALPPVPAVVTQQQPIAAPATQHWQAPPIPAPAPTWGPPPQQATPQYYPPPPSPMPTNAPPGMPASAYYPPGYQAPPAPPPGYPPGYPPQGYAPGYPPPGYPGYPPQPQVEFGFDESQSDVERVDDQPRPSSAKKAKMPVGLIVSAALLVAMIGAGAFFHKDILSFVESGAGTESAKDKKPAKEKQLADTNKKPPQPPTPDGKDKGKPPPTTVAKATPKDPKELPRPVVSGGLPRRALFIAPENYLLLNTTHFYQLREGTGAGENALLYRFHVGAPFNMEKNQIYLLSDSDEKSGEAAPQKDVIEAAIKDFAESSRPQDRIVLFFSGHACDVEGKGYLVPLEGDPADKETLIPIDWVYEQLAKCKARQKVFIVDAFRYPPARGLELPATGAMTEAVDKQLDNPPAGVQVVTACIKDQQSLEFERGSLFQSAMLDAFRKMALGAIVQGKDSLPIADIVAKANAFMKENLTNGNATTGKEKDGDPPLAQTCRLSGKEADGGAEANSAEPPATPVTFRQTNKSGSDLTRGILDEIKKFPPMKKGQINQLAAMSIGALPGGGKDIEDYKDDGFNPFGADTTTLNAMKDKYPLRIKSVEIAAALKDVIDLNMREVLNNPGGPLDAKAKKRFLDEQKTPGLALQVLEDLLDDAKKIAEKRDEEKSKRWQAHFDLSVARLQSRIVYLYGYNYLLAQVRNDSLPALDDKVHVGWRVNSSNKIVITEASVKAMAKDTSKAWDRIGTTYPGTPWAVIAKREKNVAMGLQWVPTKN